MIWVEGVALAPAVGACGMWKEEEEDGVGCGLPAWIDEAEQREGGSLARRRCCKQGVKVSTWKGRRKQGNVAFGKGEGAGR